MFSRFIEFLWNSLSLLTDLTLSSLLHKLLNYKDCMLNWCYEFITQNHCVHVTRNKRLLRQKNPFSWSSINLSHTIIWSTVNIFFNLQMLLPMIYVVRVQCLYFHFTLPCHYHQPWSLHVCNEASNSIKTLHFVEISCSTNKHLLNEDVPHSPTYFTSQITSPYPWTL